MNSSSFSVRVHPTLFVGWTLGSQPIPAKRSQAPSQARQFPPSSKPTPSNAAPPAIEPGTAPMAGH